MRVDLFSTPILIDDFDIAKLKFVEEGQDIQFGSEVKTSHGFTNIIEKDSLDYFYKKIVSNLDQVIVKPYLVSVHSIWRNYYKKGDWQEKHTHISSDFSFIIYDSVKSNTYFIHPANYLIKEKYKEKNLFETEIKPNINYGQIVIFPSYLEHYVAKAEEQSTTISGNLNIELK